MGEPSLTIISLIARMRQPSCPTNPIISIIPFLGFQIRKKNPFYFLISSFFKLRKNLQSPNLPFILSRFNDLHSINETWIVVEIFFIDPGRRRAREEDPSRRLVIQPAATMLCVSSKEEEEAVLQPRRRKGEARSQSGEGGQATTSSTNLDGARVQVGSTGW